MRETCILVYLYVTFLFKKCHITITGYSQETSSDFYRHNITPDIIKHAIPVRNIKYGSDA